MAAYVDPVVGTLLSVLESGLTRGVVVGQGVAGLRAAASQRDERRVADKASLDPAHLGVNGTGVVVLRSLLGVFFRHVGDGIQVDSGSCELRKGGEKG